ncbi:MAG: serine/threonine-protein kinase [Candidatus Brocadiia bacterium]
MLPEKFIPVRQLGEGGFARVVLCQGEITGKHVAVKYLKTSEPAALERFRREVDGMSSICHRNIVPVLAHDLNAAEPYYVMPYYCNGSLRDKLTLLGSEGKRIEPSMVLRMVLTLLEGLEHLHQHGIFHRDLKPENIFIDGDQAFVIGDLGISRFDNSECATITHAGVGTKGYCAPEQACDGTGSRQADIFSLGVVLFEILTLRQPSYGKYGVPCCVPSSVVWNIPAEIDELFRGMTAPEPQDRFGDCKVLRKRIRAILKGEYKAHRPSGVNWGAVIAAGILVGLVFVLVGGLTKGSGQTGSAK